jgi:hypothetical protein
LLLLLSFDRHRPRHESVAGLNTQPAARAVPARHTPHQTISSQA